MAEMSRMDAEIVADGDGAAVIAALTERGFELEVIHWADEGYGTTIVAAIFTDLDVDGFCDDVQRAIAPFSDVTVMSAGMVCRPSPVRGRPGVAKRSTCPCG